MLFTCNYCIDSQDLKHLQDAFLSVIKQLLIAVIMHFINILDKKYKSFAKFLITEDFNHFPMLGNISNIS